MPVGVEISLEARAHDDLLTETVRVDDDHDYAVINFWSADEQRPAPFLDYLFSDDPVAFD